MKAANQRSADRKKSLDKVTAADLEIFQKARTDVNWFSDHYFRSPTSGTYWKPKYDPPDPQRETTWWLMYETWKNDGFPEPIWTFQNRDYEIIHEDNNVVFFNNHGWLFQDWQKDWFHSRQPEVTIIGGMGSGKTACEAISAGIWAALTPNARIFCVAPLRMQAMEIYNYLLSTGSNTLWFDRWVTSTPKAPFPMVVLENDYINRSTIEIFSLEDDPKKIRTLEGDIVYVDQAEMFEDLDAVVRDGGSRLRGAIQGRPKLGKLQLVANAGDNPQLWYRFDMGELDKKTYLSLRPTYKDNIYLSETDRENLRRRVGGTQTQIDQWLEGKRPLGKGEHFSIDVIQQCTDESLNTIMDNVLARRSAGALDESEMATATQFIKKEDDKAGLYHWEMPPDKDRQYCVIGDPGQGDPPDRNSGIVMVWDLTDFPKNPMVLRAFNWIHGNGSYWPFINAMMDYGDRYHAKDRMALDSTGTQKGFGELYFDLNGLGVEGLDMANNGKMFALNAAKFLMGKALVKFPYIAHLSNQLSNYVLPDAKIRQDLVMCVAMSCFFARRFYYEDVDNSSYVNQQENVIQMSRYLRTGSDRYVRRQSVR